MLLDNLKVVFVYEAWSVRLSMTSRALVAILGVESMFIQCQTELFARDGLMLL